LARADPARLLTRLSDALVSPDRACAGPPERSTGR
jgi:hypothetical protein